MHIILGKKGEHLAKKYLKAKKYKILQLNYKNKIGEIDIIASYNNVIVFVEVKTRQSTKFGHPREAVTLAKQKKIKLVATMYLQQTKQLHNNIRFDVIDVLQDNITHIENAF